MRIFVLALFLCAPLALSGAEVVSLREGVPCVGQGDSVTSDASCTERSASGDVPYLLHAVGVTAAARLREGPGRLPSRCEM